MNRTYSAVYGDSAIGTGFASSTIDSHLAWIVPADAEHPWMVIDAGEERTIAGIMVQGRAGPSNSNQIVTSLTV
jgi:hypothetical protein